MIIWDGSLTCCSQATVKEAETLFRTTYHLFEHKKSSTMHVACDEYSIPAQLTSHIDFVSPGVHFDAKTKSDTAEYFAPDGTRLMTKRSAVERKTKRGDTSMSKSPFRHLPEPAIPHWGSFEDQICNTSFVTPVSQSSALRPNNADCDRLV